MNEVIQIKRRPNNYEFFNPNPTAKKERKDGTHPKWDKGDCAVRAMCAATGMSWTEAYDCLCRIGRETYDVPNGKQTLERMIEELGFKKIPFSEIRKNGKYLTVAEAAEKYSENRFFAIACHHAVGGDSGYYKDTWDCGCKTVRNLWIK